MEKRQAESPAVRQVFDRIELYARRTLALADGFVQLAAAETREHVFEVINLADLLHSCVDEVWPLSYARVPISCATSTVPDYRQGGTRVERIFDGLRDQ
ncbi:hypothetical protein BOC41_22870 [Burkholderia pseudomallei]|nr:hypothetical protein BOC36_23985 [Burkholderia pseudomallei]ARL05094.1 hypothetical protein BOC44_25940 [Burkholderia pseudomallei]OSP90886.1 hypothetical protein BOC41_22870 [Burkholderia pseudomallei]